MTKKHFSGQKRKKYEVIFQGRLEKKVIPFYDRGAAFAFAQEIKNNGQKVKIKVKLVDLGKLYQEFGTIWPNLKRKKELKHANAISNKRIVA